MSIIRKNRKRFSATERRSSILAFLGRLGRAVLHIVGVLAAGALLSLGGREAYRWAITSQTFSLQQISIQGAHRVGESEILKLSGLNLGQNMFRLNMANLERALGSHPWVSSVQVRRRFPSSLSISIREHIPVALAALGDLYLISEEGAPFKKLQAGDDLDLPVITGLGREQYLAAPEESAARLRRAIEAGRIYASSAPSSGPLSEVRLDADGLTLIVGDGQEIRLGEAPTEQIFERLVRVRSELERRGLSAEVIHLENRVRPGWISVKLSPAPSERRGER